LRLYHSGQEHTNTKEQIGYNIFSGNKHGLGDILKSSSRWLDADSGLKAVSTKIFYSASAIIKMSSRTAYKIAGSTVTLYGKKNPAKCGMYNEL
jgi:hypothetical protein